MLLLSSLESVTELNDHNDTFKCCGHYNNTHMHNATL